MHGTTLDTLEKRLARLERQNYRLKLVGSAVAFILAVVLLLGATGAKVPDEIRARSFVLVGGDGTRRVAMDIVQLPTFDIAGIRFYDGRGRARASLGVASDGASGLTLQNERQFTQAALSADSDGTAHVLLADKSGKAVWQVP